jgi:SAM-dependent methyltransferase
MVGARTPVLTPEPPQAVPEPPLQELLADLYRKQLALAPDNPHLREIYPDDSYLREHGRPASIANHIRTFHWYRRHLPERGTVLEWGCQHAPDSCLLRAWYGDRLSLHSCDFNNRACYPVFHDFAQSAYAQLEDEVRLPFAANFFDAVLGSGVLEHTVMDYESLKELRRVLKPEGVLILMYLPNWLSVKEWVRRVVRQRDFHRRLYGLGEAKQLLKRCGLYPVAAGYQTFFWQRLLAAVGLRRWEDGLSGVLTRLLPVHVFSSTLCLVARKVSMM